MAESKNLTGVRVMVIDDSNTIRRSAEIFLMQDILEITRQTTRGTQQAAGSIRDLASVAQELKSSVSGFKL